MFLQKAAVFVVLVGLIACGTTTHSSGPLACRGKPSKLQLAGGPEDFAVIAEPGEKYRLFLSVANRNLWGEGHSLIQTVTFDSKGVFEGLSTSFDPGTTPFHPMGLSLREGTTANDRWLYVINDQSDGDRVEQFHINGSKLISVTPEPPVEPRIGITGANDLLATADGQIYVSNFMVPVRHWPRLWFHGWPSLSWNPGQKGWEPIELDHRTANGIASSADGRLLFVSAYGDRGVDVFLRDAATGVSVGDKCRLPIDGHPDNLMLRRRTPATGDVAEAGGDKLYVTAQHSAQATSLHILTGGWWKSPASVFEVDLKAIEIDRRNEANKKDCGASVNPDLIKPIWTDDGSTVGAASTAIRLGDRLIVSQIVEPTIFAFHCDG